MNNIVTQPYSTLARDITLSASRQTYYTIRLLADRDLSQAAYRAYAYFRWVDDRIDAGTGSSVENSDFILRQKILLEGASQGEAFADATPEENLLAQLVQGDGERNSGLWSYLQHMMAVMAFDAGRRGRLISQQELNLYTHHLSIAVTEAMHYFIGHGCFAPQDESRYQAVAAAHITHMLRDTYDDLQAGYINIPREVLETNHIGPADVQSDAYRDWVRSRVDQARTYFKTGRGYLARVQNFRCKLAGCAYVARFERLLDVIENEDYYLRTAYTDHNGLGSILKVASPLAASLVFYRGTTSASTRLAAQPPTHRKS
jgi:phytoene/squalene synthetase